MRQPQAQVLESLVEAGMSLHEPPECSHSALQLNRGVEGVDIGCREHDLLICIEAYPFNHPDEIQRVPEDVWMSPDGPLQLRVQKV